MVFGGKGGMEVRGGEWMRFLRFGTCLLRWEMGKGLGIPGRPEIFWLG